MNVLVVYSPMVSRLEAKVLLRSLQSSYLRAAVGSMKTTPTPTPLHSYKVVLCWNSNSAMRADGSRPG